MNHAFNEFEGEIMGPLKWLLEESALKGTKRRQRYPNHRFFGLFCSYFPEEVILAFGLEPLRLLPDSPNATPAELPAYCCSLARGTLDQDIHGEWSDLVGVGFAHTCDTMQCLSGIWAHGGRTQTFDLVPPVMLKAAGASHYYQAEINSAWQQLKELTQQDPGEEDLHQAMELCQTYRDQVAELDALRPLLPSPLVTALLRAGQLMPRTEYITALDAAIPVLKQSAQASGSRARILISGAVLENDSLFAMIEDLGGRVVAEDTCTGVRHYSGKFDKALENPRTALVQRYIDMPPCPCKNRSLNERLTYLSDLVSNRQAEGVIIVLRKYCDPHAWDAVTLAEGFQRRGIRTLILELEGSEVGGPERTRLQAFLEGIVENRGLLSAGRDNFD